MKYLIKYLAVTMLVSCGFRSLSWAAIEYKDVESEGRGPTFGEAVTDALIEAIGRVNGRAIESETSVRSVEVSAVENDNENYFSSEAFQSKIKNVTKGVVASYEIRNKSLDGTDHVVNVLAKIAKYKPSTSALRKRIAVFPLRLSDKPFNIDGRTVNRGNVNRKLTQNIASQLVQSRRFTVLDREYVSENLGEKRMILSGDVPTEEIAKLGQELVADLVLVGTIEDFGVASRKVRTRLTQRELTSRTGFVNVGYRILDVPTRQIKFADFLKLSIQDGELKEMAPSLTSGELESGICMRAAAEIGGKVLNAIYPILVVSARGDTLTLGQGGLGVKVGDRLEVFQYGKKIIDPYNKESLGREEILAAKVEVIRVNPKISIAKVMEAEIDIESSFEPKKFVCRIPADSITPQAAKKLESKKKLDENRKKRDSLFD